MSASCLIIVNISWYVAPFGILQSESIQNEVKMEPEHHFLVFTYCLYAYDMHRVAATKIGTYKLKKLRGTAELKDGMIERSRLPACNLVSPTHRIGSHKPVYLDGLFPV